METKQKPKSIIQQIKDTLDICEVAGKYYPDLDQDGDNLRGSHGSVHASASGTCLIVYKGSQTYKCNNCGEYGDVIDLIGRYELADSYDTKDKTNFRHALATAARMAGIPFGEVTEAEISAREEAEEVFNFLTEAQDYFVECLQNSPVALEWVKTKYGWTAEQVKEEKLGLAPTDKEFKNWLSENDYKAVAIKSALLFDFGVPHFQNRLIFPYHKGGKVAYMAARYIPELTKIDKYEHYADKEGQILGPKKFKKLRVDKPEISTQLRNIPLGLDNIRLGRQKGYTLLCEGAPDYISAKLAGEPCISPVTVGFSEEMKRYIANALKGTPKLYISFDNEENKAGEKGMLKTAEYFEREGIPVYLFELPKQDEKKIDIADYLMNHTGDDLRELYRSAKRLPEFTLAKSTTNAESDHTDLTSLVKDTARLCLLCNYNEIAIKQVKKLLAKKLGLALADMAVAFGDAGTDYTQEQTKEQSRNHLEILQDKFTLWADLENNGFATFDNEGHKEHWSIDSKYFELVVRRELHELGIVPGSSQVNDLIDNLRAIAIFSGVKDKPYRRVAEKDGVFYYDLCNGKWEVVKIDAKGWTIETEPPVKFVRSTAALPQVTPRKNDTVKMVKVKDFINLEDSDWPLMAAYILAALNPTIPYPIAAINGEQGSAKSGLSEILKAIIDPHAIETRSAPKEEKDLWVATSSSHLLVFENLSCIPDWLSDAFCKISTGSAYASRSLYSNGEEFYLKARLPIMLNGIGDLATRGDLIERSIQFTLPTIPEAKRKPLKEIKEGFETIKPDLMGAIFTAISGGLSRLAQTAKELTSLPRMADFAIWATACQPEYKREKDVDVLELYRDMLKSGFTTALDASPLAHWLTRWFTYELRGKAASFEYEPSEAFEKFNEFVKSYTTEASIEGKTPRRTDYPEKHKQWPQVANAFTKQVNRLSPSLRKDGWDITSKRSGQKRELKISAVTMETQISDDEIEKGDDGF